MDRKSKRENKRRKNFSIPADICRRMEARPDIVWSQVVTNYLKVYFYDLEQQPLPRLSGSASNRRRIGR